MMPLFTAELCVRLSVGEEKNVRSKLVGTKLIDASAEGKSISGVHLPTRGVVKIHGASV